MLTSNDPAPLFSLPDAEGEIFVLASHHSAPVVVFFYPRDDTSGCTTEAKEFSALLGEFDRLGVKVVGISKDTVNSHQKFISKHALTVTLLSDADAQTCEDYGVWKEKSMYGKVFWGIERSTFIIGTDGKIAAVWRKVKVPGHAGEVLAKVKSL